MLQDFITSDWTWHLREFLSVAAENEDLEHESNPQHALKRIMLYGRYLLPNLGYNNALFPRNWRNYMAHSCKLYAPIISISQPSWRFQYISMVIILSTLSCLVYSIYVSRYISTYYHISMIIILSILLASCTLYTFADISVFIIPQWQRSHRKNLFRLEPSTNTDICLPNLFGLCMHH